MANLSVFPTQIDTFIEHYEIQAQDINNINTYQQLLMNPNRTPDQDTQLTSLTNTLRDKLISADDWNKIQDCITNLETFFTNNVDGYITQKQSEFDALVAQFQYMGTYSASTTYNQMNTVTYNFETYQCLANGVVNAQPDTNPTKWAKIAAQGQQGPQGLPGMGLIFRGIYTPNFVYNQGDAVQYNGSAYYCNVNNTNAVVPTNTTNWTMFNAAGTSFVPTWIKNTVTISSASNTVAIGIAQFNSVSDPLMVFQDSTYIENGQDYIVTGSAGNYSIQTKDGSNWTSGSTFNFLVLKNVQTNLVYTDGTMIQDGTITNAKLTTDAKVGSLATLKTVAKTDAVSAINEIAGRSVVGIGLAVASNATSIAVTFATAQADTNYVPHVTVYWDTNVYISNKTVNGFTANFGTAPTVASTIDWDIHR